MLSYYIINIIAFKLYISTYSVIYIYIAQSAGAVEYTDCTSAEG